MKQALTKEEIRNLYESLLVLDDPSLQLLFVNAAVELGYRIKSADYCIGGQSSETGRSPLVFVQLREKAPDTN